MATVDNDIIKITLASNSSGNVITVSPGISALGSVSISLNEINNVDTTGIVNGQTIVYQNGSFVAGDAGVQTLEELTDTNIIGVQGGDVIAWNSGASKWMVSDGLQTLLSLLKSQSGTQLYNTSLDTDKGYIDLQATTAKMGLGQSFLKVTQTSPGVLTFSIACGAEGAETEFEAFKLQGTTTADVADLLIQSGCRFKLYDTNGYEIWIKPSGGMTGNVTLVTPATGGTLALQSEIPTSVTDLSDVTSAGSGAIITTAERDAIGGMPAGGTTGQALIKTSGADYDTEWADIAIDTQYHNRFQTDAETFRSGATETVELYYTAKADGDGLAESASSDTPTAGKVIKRKIYYSEAAFADPDTGTWVEFTPAPADDASFATVKAALLEYLKARTGGTVPISLKQTWEEVDAAPAFTGLLNETYGSGAEAAYSTRRLNGNVTDCMVIRRASDSTTQTIGFDGSGNISEADINTFCSGTTCTVYQWIDQSGNGNTATAAAPANEPTIYTNGAIVKRNGKAAILGANDVLQFTSVTNSGDFLILALYEVFLSDAILGGATSSNTFIGIAVASYNPLLSRFSGLNFSSSIQLSANKKILHTINRSGTALNNIKGKVDGVDVSTGTNNNDASLEYIFSGDGGGDRLSGAAQEIILYNQNKSIGDTTSIEQNVGGYFTQNTPLLDTYSGAAAAYSLRKLRTAYTGAAIEVFNGTSYQDIGFNVFGELDTVSLAAFCGANNGFVSKWYDQSGNANDATQTTPANQPKIYDSVTGVIKEGSAGNEKPAVEFDGTNDVLQNLNIGTNQSNQATIYLVFHKISGQGGVVNWSGSNSLANTIRYTTSPAGYRFGWSSSVVGTDTGAQLLFMGQQDGTNGIMNIDGTSQGTFTMETVRFWDKTMYIGNALGLGTPQMKMSEFVMYWSVDSASEISGIESNINTFYSIY